MSQISQIDIVINEGIHMDHKNKIDLVFQLFVYILQVDVLASNGCVPDFFQLIMKIYIKIDF